ncbi:MAG: class B sortase [Oscillospiraceae bacterium]|nr:class B sortase [Oscillospiraceae bacterium]
MSAATRIGRRAIRTTNAFVNFCMLVIILLLLAFGSYAMWDSSQLHGAASAVNYERYRPDLENDADSFAELQAINPDVFAWLTVYGTNIDYPMVQGQDNIRYVNTDARGRHALSGAIFLDFRNSPHFTDFSSIVYGHHMENYVMFGELELFEDKSYFDARRYGMLYFDGQERGLEFFAFVHADAYDTTVFRARIVAPEEQQAYLDMLLEMATHTRTDMSVTIEDRIVLLSTCSPTITNGRDILLGRITSEVQDNPFPAEQTNNVVEILRIDTVTNWWFEIDLLVQISIATLILALVVLVIVVVCRKRRKGDIS